MLFSEVYKINNPQKENWFDPYLDFDTQLFIDPMLVFQNELDDFKNSPTKIKNFFEEAFNRVASAKGTLGAKREFALKMLKFKEAYEIYLGYTSYGSGGSGIGDDFARQIFDAIINFIELGFEEFGTYLGPFEIFVEKIGADRISDMIANIIKEDLIKYTIKICEIHNIPTKRFTISNYSFDQKLGWIQKKVDLPENPLNHKPVILVPRDFLRATSLMDREDFIEYVLHMKNEELRAQVTSLITEDINKEKLRNVIREKPEIFKKAFKEYIKQKEAEKAEPYDFINDPDMKYWFYESLKKLSNKLNKIEVTEESFDSLKSFVEKVIEEFKKCVESNEGYKLLFNDDGSPRKERAAQVFFSQIALTFCKLSGKVDLSPESQTGRGPVDFKFSKGYTHRIIVEIKLASSDHIYHGLEKQLPVYLESSDVCLGYYLVIKQLGGDNTRVIKLNDRYQKMESIKKEKIKISIIDCYIETKVSGSKV